MSARMHMDHAEAREQIEIAAAEPDGLERLFAGDTPEAAALAGHLAGCPACVDELARVRRVAAVARAVIAAEPDPALKERTLAFVRATGVDRSRTMELVSAMVAPTPVPAPSPEPVPIATPTAILTATPLRRRRPSLALFGSIAAALLLAGVVGYAAGGGFAPADEDYESEIAVLADATTTALALAGAPDATVVPMAPTAAGGASAGSLVFSPASGELVMFARGLADPAAGSEYGCWVEVNGERQRIGTMYAAGVGWAWSGPAEGLAALPAGATFGVSLVPAGGAAGEPVLLGRI